MKSPTPQETLYGLEPFGYPTRNWYFEDAKKLVEQGLLTQQQVDGAWKIGQDKIDAENIKMYGTKNPTPAQIFEHGLKILKSVKFSENFVEMNDGKYSYGKELITSARGCTLSLLYFENQEEQCKRHGILTHYDPINLTKNFDKLIELRKKLTFKPDYQKGVLLTSEDDKHFRDFRNIVEVMFPRINLETIVYDGRELDVAINPAEKYWGSNLHGRKNF
jgi:hypothetical protein